jgi:hypothetical protein
MPTVPSCEACNTGASDDDEHVRNLIVMHHSVSDVPAASDAVDKFTRAIENPKKFRYLRNLQTSISEVETASFGGILLGQQSGYSVDVARFEKTYTRYIKGLHWREFGAVNAGSLDAKVLLDPETLRHKAEQLMSEMSDGTLKTIAPSVFWYMYTRLNDRFSTTWWLTCHFDNFPVLVRTQIHH